jgi:hypothetical protein
VYTHTHTFLLLIFLLFSFSSVNAQSSRSWDFPDCSDENPNDNDLSNDGPSEVPPGDNSGEISYTHYFNDPLSLSSRIYNFEADDYDNPNHLDIHGVTCAWDITQGDPEIKVAVLDSEFLSSHIELSEDYSVSFANCVNTVEGHHGIQQAGAITAEIDNGQLIAGVCKDIDVRAYCKSNGGYVQAHYDAFDEGHRIIGSSIYEGDDPLPTVDAEFLTENGMVILQSARGDRRQSSKYVPGVIHVGRASASGEHSNYGGNDLDIGIDVLIITSNMPRINEFDGGEPTQGGTSIATPFLTGIVALMRSANPCLPPAEIEEILVNTSWPQIGVDEDTPFIEGGVVNAWLAVNAARDFVGVDESWTSSMSINNRSVTGNLTVESGHTVVSGNLYMMPENRIIINSGATLELNGGSIKMGDGCNILVKRGGKLILDNGTITTSYCSSEWQGIWVEGNSLLPQPDVNGVQAADAAGILHIKNNSIVENARFAVNLKANSIDYPGVGQPYFYGGLIVAENSTFKNNGKAVAFWRYGSIANADKSIFTNVNFQDNDIGVSNWRSDGVEFNGCQFSGYKTGILSYNAGISVINGCVFDSPVYDVTQPGVVTTIGIDIKSLHPSVGVPLIGKENTLANTFQGGETAIFVNGKHSFNRLDIQNNSINDAYTGIQISGISNFEVSGNTIVGGHEGCVVKNAGGLQSLHRNNHFLESDFPLTIVGENPRYRFLQNCFEDTEGLYDVWFASTGGTVSVAGEQWTDDFDAADNNFFDNAVIVGNVYNILLPTIGTAPFNYYYSGEDENSNSYRPGFFAPGEDTDEFATAIPTNAPNPNEDICGASPGLLISATCDTPNNITGIENLIDILITSISELGEPETELQKKELYSLERCLNKLKNGLLKKYAETKNYSQAITKFASDEFDYKIMVHGILMHDGEYEMARTYVNDLPTIDEAEVDFITIQNIYLDLIEAGQAYPDNFNDSSADERDNPLMETIHTIAMKENRLSCYAHSLWHLLTGEHIRFPISRDLPSGFEDLSSVSNDFLLFPNPTANECKLTIPNEINFGVVEVIDLNGRRILEERIIGNIYSINTETWTSGIFIIRILGEENNLLWQSKLVHL